MRPAVVSVLERAGDSVGAFLPRLGASVAILLAGLLAIRILGRVVTRLLVSFGVDRVAEHLHVHDVIARLGLDRSLSRLLVGALRLAGVVTVLLAALSVLGLRSLDEAIAHAVLFLPRLLAATALALVGLSLGGLARERVDRLAFQMDLAGPVGPTAQTLTAAVFAVLALGELGVPTAILTVLAAIVLAGAMLTGALAFGLGGQQLARELSAGRYVGAAFHLGQYVTVGGHHGEITRIDTMSVLMTGAEGRLLRIPNTMFMRGAVEVHDGPGDP